MLTQQLLVREGHNVRYALNLEEAKNLLRTQQFDIVILDMLFNSEIDEMEALVKAGELHPLRGKFFKSGLAVLDMIEEEKLNPKPGVVIWSAGDADRRLHLIYAHERFRVNVFCRKGSRYRRRSDDLSRNPLLDAIAAAAGRQEYIDKDFVSDFGRNPGRVERPSLREILFEDEANWPPIWRALALRITEHKEIARELGQGDARFSLRRANLMWLNASQLEAIAGAAGQGISMLAIVATEYRAFFLDDTVHRHFPGALG